MGRGMVQHGRHAVATDVGRFWLSDDEHVALSGLGCIMLH